MDHQTFGSIVTLAGMSLHTGLRCNQSESESDWKHIFGAGFTDPNFFRDFDGCIMAEFAAKAYMQNGIIITVFTPADDSENCTLCELGVISPVPAVHTLKPLRRYTLSWRKVASHLASFHEQSLISYNWPIHSWIILDMCTRCTEIETKGDP